MANTTRDPSIIHLKIDKNHLVRTGFMEHYNELLLTTVYNAYLDTNTGLLTLQREKGDICIPFTLTGLADVNITDATAGQVLGYNGTNWVNVDAGGIFNYVRNEQSTRHPDILNVTSVVDALDKILYPFIDPSFASFFIQGVSSTLELGDCISTTAGGVDTFQWSVNTLTNVSETEGYVITDVTNALTLETGILPRTTTTQAVNIPYGICNFVDGATQVFRIQGKDLEDKFFTRDVTYTWRPRIFWGISPKSTALNNAEIEALATSTVDTSKSGTKLSNSLAQEFLMDGEGEYLWIAMPQSSGLAIEANGDNSKFVVGGIANSAWNLFSVNYTNSFGHTEPYYLYKTLYLQNGTGIDVKIVV
jgi:hypothetical protein